MSRILSWVGVNVSVLLALSIPATPIYAETTMSILAFGDSLIAGYGLPASASFAAQLEKRLHDEGRVVRVINAGVSGDTTSGGLARLDWSLQDKPDVVILELGANDALRGLDTSRIRANLETMIQKCLAAKAQIILVGMRCPVNWGEDYRHRFEALFPDLAKAYHLPLYPFFLDGVIGNQALVLDDGLHPNSKGVARMVDGILPLVRQVLDKT